LQHFYQYVTNLSLMALPADTFTQVLKF